MHEGQIRTWTKQPSEFAKNLFKFYGSEIVSWDFKVIRLPSTNDGLITVQLNLEDKVIHRVHMLMIDVLRFSVAKTYYKP